MSAIEVIRQIEQLPEDEFAKVRDFVTRREIPASSPAVMRDEPRPAGRRKSFEEAMEHVFREHHELFRRLAQ